MENYVDIIKTILPEATPLNKYSSAKWKYKSYEICIPCGYIINRSNDKERYRFKQLQPDIFKELLLKIKNENK